MYNTIVSQLEKALKCKDDKELRMRVEVLLDVIKEQKQQSFPQGFPQTSPQSFPQTSPQVPKNPAPTVSNTPPKITSPGALISRSEQINYTRPEGT